MICVAKLYDLKPELVLEKGFLEQLSRNDLGQQSNGALVCFSSCSRSSSDAP